MAEDSEEQRRSAAASGAFQRYRARAFESGHYVTPRAGGRGVADFGAPPEKAASGVAEQAAQQPEGGAAGWQPSPGTYRSKTGPGRSHWDPQTIGDVLAVESRRRGWEETLQVASVTADWAQIVGPHVAEHCPIESFEGTTLVARADSTAWAQQLKLLLPHIHKRIDDRVGPGVVNKVVVLAPRAPSWTKGKRVYQGGRGPRDTYG